jgi:phosphatidylglycerol lysyltransferase
MIEHELLRFGYVILFLGTMVEGDGFLLTAAFLAHRGYFHLGVVIAVATAANTLADQIYYQLARSRGREAFARKAEADPRFGRVRTWIEHRGVMLLLASRFLWGFRIAIPAACGASGMGRRTFLLVNLAGGLIWASVFAVLGYTLGGTLDVLLANLRHLEWYVAGGLLLAVALVVALRAGEFRGGVDALRRPAQAATEFAGRLFGYAHRASLLVISYPEARLAGLVIALGFLNTVSALFHWHPLRIEAVESWLPLAVSHGSRALIFLNGLALILVGRGLARRKQAAWAVAAGVTALSILLHLGHHASILRAAVSAVLLVELVRNGARFTARSDPWRVRHGLIAAPVLALALTVFGVIGLHEHYAHLPIRAAIAMTWRSTVAPDQSSPPPPPNEAAFLDSLRLLALVSGGYVLVALLAPVAFRRGSTADAGRVAEIAWTHGEDSLSYFAKQPDKRHFLASDDVFLGYRVVNRVAIVAGDPVGPLPSIPGAIRRFVGLCRSNDWIPVFYEASARHLTAYQACGLRAFKVGEEAVIPLAGFSLQGGKVAKLRQNINKVEREVPDLKIVEYRRDEAPDPEIDEQLEEISEEWLANKRGGELGFNLGVFSVTELTDKRTIVAVRDDGQIQAFLTWLPYRAGRALVLDAMRRRSAAHFGLMDALIVRSALMFKAEGLEAVSLATAPLANLDETGASTPYDKGVRLIFEHFSAFYGYESLLQFKRKFNPAWEGRYLAFPRPDQLPRIAYALVAVHSGGIIRLLLNRRPAHVLAPRRALRQMP